MQREHARGLRATAQGANRPIQRFGLEKCEAQRIEPQLEAPRRVGGNHLELNLLPEIGEQGQQVRRIGRPLDQHGRRVQGIERLDQPARRAGAMVANAEIRDLGQYKRAVSAV